MTCLTCGTRCGTASICNVYLIVTLLQKARRGTHEAFVNHRQGLMVDSWLRALRESIEKQEEGTWQKWTIYGINAPRVRIGFFSRTMTMRVLDEAPALPVTKLIRLCFLYSYLCENIKRIKPAAEQCAQAAMRKIIEFIDCSLLSNRLGAKASWFSRSRAILCPRRFRRIK